ncbi:MAG: tetratricopeptide repeat protein [Candidatus Aminicenantes bacterium]|nr:tetratricopeptide repeat protein [Candidatus Aminicenantes bacterium]
MSIQCSKTLRLFFFLAAAAGLTMCGWATQWDDQEWEEWDLDPYAWGMKLRSEGDLAGARKAFKSALSDDPDHARAFAELLKLEKPEEAHLYRGREYADDKRPDKAVQDFTRAIEIAPGFAPALLERAYALCLLNQPEKAIADCTAVIGRDSGNGWAYALRGWAQEKRGNLEQAEADYLKAWSLGARDRYGRDLLMWSLGGRSEVAARAILATGVDVTAKRGKETPLHLAAGTCTTPVVRIVLDRGADVNARDDGRVTPLFYAAWRGAIDTVKLLLEKGADPKAVSSYLDTPLHWASRGRVVELLTAAGADLEARDKLGRTPLHRTAYLRYAGAVKALLAAGANVNVMDSSDYTPLLLAVRPGNKEIVEALLKAGADMTARSRGRDGRTALENASRDPKTADIAELLRAWRDRKGKAADPMPDSLPKARAPGMPAAVTSCGQAAPAAAAPDAAREEQTYLALPEERIDVGRGTLLIARGLYPDLDVDRYVAELDAMATALRPKIESLDDPMKMLMAIGAYLLGERKFRYNQQEDSARFLNRALDTKTFNCESWTTLYVALGQRLGLPLCGVAAPGHLFVRFHDGRTRINLDQNRIGHPDRYYIEEYGIPPGTAARGVYLRDLTKREMLAAALVSRAVYRPGAEAEARIRDCDAALSLNPNQAYAFTIRGLARGSVGDAAAALDDFERALELDPQSTDAHFGRGAVLTARGKLSEAIRAYDRALELHAGAGPKHAPPPPASKAKIHSGRAWTYEKSKDYTRALDDLNRAIALDPDPGRKERYAQSKARVLHQLARKELERKDNAGAIALLTEAISITPDNTSLRSARAEICARNGKWAQAAADYDELIRLEPDKQTWRFDRGMARFALGRHDDALADFDRVLEIKAKNLYGARAHRGRGLVFMERGDLDAALAEFDAALRYPPPFADSASYLPRGRIRLQRGDVKGALADLNLAVVVNIDPKDKAQALFFRGQAWAADDNAAKADADFKQAVELDPSLEQAVAAWRRKAAGKE